MSQQMSFDENQRDESPSSSAGYEEVPSSHTSASGAFCRVCGCDYHTEHGV